MKKFISFTIIIVLLGIQLGCDESFSPYGEYQKRYYLNCIVRADTNLQITTLFQSYALNNKSSSENRSESYIHNSSVRLWRDNDEIYFFADSSIGDTNFYYSKGMKPKPDDSLEIEAILPDGNRLRAKTKVPDYIQKDLNNLSEIVDGKNVTFAWIPNEESQVFAPVLYIYYKNTITGKVKKKLVPWKYIKENGKSKGIHRPPLKSPIINYDIENIEKVLKDIAKNNDTDITKILSLILDVRVFDKNLSAYYLSIGRINGNYTIRLDSKEFSNIEGGYGIFGSFSDQKIFIPFDADYLSRFNFHQKTL